MKKLRIPAALLLLLAVLALSISVGRRPFRTLDPDSIVSASVQLTPPGETLPVPDTAELAELLQAQVVYRRDGSYTEYDGQAVTFTLELTGGASLKPNIQLAYHNARAAAKIAVALAKL